MFKKKRIRNELIVITSIFLIAILSSSIFLFENLGIEIEPKYSFSEMSYVDYSFEKSEQNNVYSLLDSLVFEDSYVFGFTNNSNTTIDLYKANTAICTSTMFSEYQKNSFKSNLSFLEHVDIKRLDFLNLTYFISLCLNLEIDFDYSEIESALLKYYDNEENLFFIDSTEDSVGDKLIATATVKRSVGEMLNNMSFNLNEGILNAFETFSFEIENNITLYNSGGNILYCMSIYDMQSEIDNKNLVEWFDYWKQLYESNPIESIIAALQYSEYLNIAKIFDPEYSNDKLQEYYNSLKEQDIENLEDLYMLYNIATNVNPTENPAVVAAIQGRLDKIITDEELFQSNIDIQSTVFGVVLAQKVGYQLNEAKLKNLIKQNYEQISTKDNSYDRTLMLYYNIILDQLVNDQNCNYENTDIQLLINSILEMIKYEQSIPADIVSTRRIVEIVMDLQMFDIDIKISNKQRSQIKKGVDNALKDSNISKSVLMNDIFIIDRTLSLNAISAQEFISIYEDLNSNGGVLALNGKDIYPDISSTYQFIVSLERLAYNMNLDEHKDFIKSLEKENGLYLPDASATDTTNLTVIVYANAIKNLEFGRNKINDSTK